MTNETDRKLKPCPFCGGTKPWIHAIEYDPCINIIMCPDCKMEMTTPTMIAGQKSNNKQRTIELWNMRANDYDTDRTTDDQCGDGAKMIDLKKRTITERLIIANSLIASAIADSDNNQLSNSFSKEPSEDSDSDQWWKNYIRSRMSQDDVPDNNVGDTINRQAAIDAMCSACGHDCDKSKFVYNAPQDEQVIMCPEHYALSTLPSAQPERCEDCENFIKTRLLIPQPEKRTEECTETHACDLISRQAAINAIHKNSCNTRRILDAVEALPSAQPEVAQQLYQYKCYITDNEGLQHEVIHIDDIRRVTGWMI